jgi:hypothetical protein
MAKEVLGTTGTALAPQVFVRIGLDCLPRRRVVSELIIKGVVVLHSSERNRGAPLTAAGEDPARGGAKAPRQAGPLFTCSLCKADGPHRL